LLLEFPVLFKDYSRTFPSRSPNLQAGIPPIQARPTNVLHKERRVEANFDTPHLHLLQKIPDALIPNNIRSTGLLCIKSAHRSSFEEGVAH